MLRLPTRSTLFPYTTLFRSRNSLESALRSSWTRKRRQARRRPHLEAFRLPGPSRRDRKSTRLNSSHSQISYAVFCLKKKTIRMLGEINHRQLGGGDEVIDEL